MCVIMTSDVAKPSQAMMEAGHEKNSWGAGVAWQEKDKKGVLWNRWEKGIVDVKDTIKLVNSLPDGPIVVHFRIPTEGLSDISLTHPFPVSVDAELSFHGKTRSKLLFHNGGWGNWRNFSLETAQKAGRKLPQEGMLSDSRMMAWNCDFYGPGFLYLINEKVILFGVENGIEIFGPKGNGGWDYDPQTKIWSSNTLWQQCMPKPKQEYMAVNQRQRDGRGGDRPQAGFRPHREPQLSHELVGGGYSDSQQMEGCESDFQAQSQQTREVVGKDGTPAIRRPLTSDPEFVNAVKALGQENTRINWGGMTRRVIQLHAGRDMVM
jgi:hypothetical protein